jgi:hypothetical protein
MASALPDRDSGATSCSRWRPQWAPRAGTHPAPGGVQVAAAAALHGGDGGRWWWRGATEDGRNGWGEIVKIEEYSGRLLL